MEARWYLGGCGAASNIGSAGSAIGSNFRPNDHVSIAYPDCLTPVFLDHILVELHAEVAIHFFHIGHFSSQAKCRVLVSQSLTELTDVSWSQRIALENLKSSHLVF